MNTETKDKIVNAITVLLLLCVIIIAVVLFIFVNRSRMDSNEANVRRLMTGFIRACETFKETHNQYPSDMNDLFNERPPLYDVKVHKVSEGHWMAGVKGYLISYSIYEKKKIIQVVATAVGAQPGPKMMSLSPGSDIKDISIPKK